MVICKGENMGYSQAEEWRTFVKGEFAIDAFARTLYVRDYLLPKKDFLTFFITVIFNYLLLSL